MKTSLLTLSVLLIGPAVCAQEPVVLTIQECLKSARKNNKNLIEGRQRLRELDYDRWDLRSRFFPTVNLEGRYHLPDRTGLEGSLNADEAILRARQRIFEFGADAREEVTFRSERRQSVFEYERRLRQALSRTRRNFYLAILKEQQIQSRMQVLKSASDKLRRIRIKYARGVATEFDLLTAQLDSLEQEGQINVLLGDQQRLKFELLRLIGRPIATDVILTGELEPFGMSIEEAVELALRQDVEVRRLREEVEERFREFTETSFAYLPDVGFQIGLESGDTVTRLDLSRSSQTRTWQMDLSSDVLLSRTKDLPLDHRFRELDTNRFALLQVSVPLLAGFQRYGQTGAARARLHQLQTELSDRRDQVERNVRQRYQTLRERTLQREINTRRLEIARRRLGIQERLRDLGQVTDNQVETFRQRFFQEQERLFRTQDAYIASLEDLREVIGYFE